ncbi:conserved exported hypothetical protein [Rhodospirillaceae bacterium LM-1]|nr:conserved exported hypothetical protein [Rhodospirillaceae bacterium LM-1]
MNLPRVAVGLGLALSLAACQTAEPSEARLALAAPSPHLSSPPTFSPVTPERLVGLTEIEIQGLLGQPNLRRKEAPAELWQYSGGGCVIDLYLYREGEAQKVSYVSLRDQVTGRIGGAACQERLAKLSGN